MSICAFLCCSLPAPAQEIVSTPFVPSGPTSGSSGTLYQYIASGSTSSAGDAVLYSFQWGDGSSSGWTPSGVTMSFHAWSTPGTYTVRAQARSSVDASAVSGFSDGLVVTITGETISTPSAPTGPASAVTGTPGVYSAGGSVSSAGSQLRYELFWGDGSLSGWLPVGTTSASHSWPGPGTYTVTARARSAANSQVLSAISPGLTVTVAAGETISPPTAPAGPTDGAPATSYTYSTGGAVSSSGNAVAYLFDWGDGHTPAWLPAGTTTASHSWASPGSYAVTALAADPNDWLILSTPSSGTTVNVMSPPSIASLSPNSGPVGAAVAIVGSNFGSSQGSSTVTFNGIDADTVGTWGAGRIVVDVPSGATIGNAVVVVTTAGGASGGVSFTVLPPPVISSVTPASGPVGTVVTIAGSGFGASQGRSSLQFDASVVTVTSWSDTSIVMTVPTTEETAPPGVPLGIGLWVVNGTDPNTWSITGANPMLFTITPSITSLSQSSGTAGTSLTINGYNFSYHGTPGTVTFNGVAATLSSWHATTITVTVPSLATTGDVVVNTGGYASNPLPFTVLIMPAITSVSPTTGVGGTQVVISGSGFGSTQGTSAVWLGTTPGAVVSWSDTQIVATVASNATSGSVRIQQSGLWSNEVPFTVNTPTISTVVPATGEAGTPVTITGSGFGASQGIGQVWLGTANGVVQSWSDTQIVALVAAGAYSGNAQVLQGGVMSNAVSFTVEALQLTSISPNSGVAGDQVTFTGTGFGASPGVVWLGSTAAGSVVSWSDTQVVATVGSSAVSGIARIQQDGVWSNAVGFTVPSASGNTLAPALLNMLVGDTRTLQALGSAGQTVTGLTWATSDPTIVSLSTDDPPVLTALAAGHATITAGSGSADVTVFTAALPIGTVIWSNPGNGSGVQYIVPAVPSASGVADVFAFQADGTVAAITSDGTTAWTATLGNNTTALPDFQGGLLMLDSASNSIYKLDGITGQAYPAYAPGSGGGLGTLAMHPDGTIFTVVGAPDNGPPSVVGIDPTTGGEKFSVPLDVGGSDWWWLDGGMMIAGDGYAYLPYKTSVGMSGSLGIWRVNSSGASDTMVIDSGSKYCVECDWFGASLITNADQGILFTWSTNEQDGWHAHMGLVTNGAPSVVSAPRVPGGWQVFPLLQAQDGSFFGTDDDDIVAFDAAGNTRWIVPNDYPQIAASDGGVIGYSGIVYDQDGRATGMINTATQSWTGNEYLTSGAISQVALAPYFLGASFWAQAGGQYSPGTAGYPVDSVTTYAVIGNAFAPEAPPPLSGDSVRPHDDTVTVNGILSRAEWAKFRTSHCAVVLGNKDNGLPSMWHNARYPWDPNMNEVQRAQTELRFYDTGNPYWANMPLNKVLPAAYAKYNDLFTMGQYLTDAKASAATPVLGAPGPIPLAPGFFQQKKPQVTLIHEVLIHAYAGVSDTQVENNSYFKSQHYWFDGVGSATISSWMSTDCTCTPENPDNQKNGVTCNANTAKW